VCVCVLDAQAGSGRAGRARWRRRRHRHWHWHPHPHPRPKQGQGPACPCLRLAWKNPRHRQPACLPHCHTHGPPGGEGGRKVYLQSKLLKRTVLVARAQTALRQGGGRRAIKVLTLLCLGDLLRVGPNRIPSRFTLPTPVLRTGFRSKPNM